MLDVLIGAALILNCIFLGETKWFFEHSPVQNGEVIINNAYNITSNIISEINLAHFGKYQCKGTVKTNKGVSILATYNLRVYGINITLCSL